MKKQILSVAVALIAASLFFGCKSNGVSSEDVTSLINGPNSFKGTISGTMRDTAVAYSFPFDFHYTTNDGNSGTEGYVQDGGTYDGVRVIEIWQYFYFDRNGYDDYYDSWSTSGQYAYLSLYFNAETLELMPLDFTNTYMEGMFQTITKSGNRFVYDVEFNSSNSTPGTLTTTNVKYDKSSQILSGTVTISMPDGNGNYHQYGNTKATVITAQFRSYVPKEDFQVTTKGSYYGQVYRTRK